MTDDNLFITTNAFNECFTVCKPENAETEIRRALDFYKRDLKTYKSHLVNYPDNKENWKREIDRLERILSEGIVALNWDEFYQRQCDQWLSKEAEEITEEQWDYALNVLPPVNWHGDEKYSTFFMSERMTMTFTSQYYHDKVNNRYYTALVDELDESTWIDKLLCHESNGDIRQIR